MEDLLLGNIKIEKRRSAIKMANWDLNERRKYAWKYFEVHAGQRMSLFNFFAVISALLTGGLAATLKKDSAYPVFGLFLGVALVIISFVFWKLDKRVGYLIKHAETALKEIELLLSEKQEPTERDTALFCCEETETRKKQMLTPWYKLYSYHMTYSQCFKVVYLMFGVIGIIGIFLACRIFNFYPCG
jgi:hypothetical protein